MLRTEKGGGSSNSPPPLSSLGVIFLAGETAKSPVSYSQASQCRDRCHRQPRHCERCQCRYQHLESGLEYELRRQLGAVGGFDLTVTKFIANGVLYYCGLILGDKLGGALGQVGCASYFMRKGFWAAFGNPRIVDPLTGEVRIEGGISSMGSAATIRELRIG